MIRMKVKRSTLSITPQLPSKTKAAAMVVMVVEVLQLVCVARRHVESDVVAACTCASALPGGYKDRRQHQRRRRRRRRRLRRRTVVTTTVISMTLIGLYDKADGAETRRLHCLC
jgi:hypothetical protein